MLAITTIGCPRWDIRLWCSNGKRVSTHVICKRYFTLFVKITQGQDTKEITEVSVGKMGLLCVMLTGESLYCSPDSGGGGNGKSYTLLIFFDTTVNCYVTMCLFSCSINAMLMMKNLCCSLEVGPMG